MKSANIIPSTGFGCTDFGNCKNDINDEVDIGELPFTWRDVMKTFEVGDKKKYPTNGPTMVLSVRVAICRYQNMTGTQFTTNVDEEGFIHIWKKRLNCPLFDGGKCPPKVGALKELKVVVRNGISRAMILPGFNNVFLGLMSRFYARTLLSSRP